MSKAKDKVEDPVAADSPTEPQPEVIDAAKRARPTVYVGPALPRDGLMQNMVFRGGLLPAHVRKLADGNPAIAGLIVPIAEMAKAVAATKTLGTRLNSLFVQVQKGGK